MRRLKLLAGLSTAALAGAFAFGAYGCGEGEGGGKETASRSGESGEGRSAGLAEGSEGEGAEGEGAEGEGEGTAGAARGAETASYLSQLLMLKGHLKAGALLYEAGESDFARAHMKHPHDELYVALKPALDAYGASELGGAIERLAAAVEGGASASAVDSAFRTVEAAVRSARATRKPAIRDDLLAAAMVLRAAGEEYNEGVKAGAIVNAKEYQDAYGFITATVESLAAIEGATLTEKEAVAMARAQAAIALAATPGIAPEGPLGEGAPIYGAAARIELAALSLD